MRAGMHCVQGSAPAIHWRLGVREQIEHEILNSRDLSKKGPRLLGVRHAEREQGDRSLRAITEPRYGEPAMKGASKMNACIMCGRKVQPTENWIRPDHLWGGFASFHWRNC